MSYDPSHPMPPRQERWPQATPPEGWPSYRDGGAYRDGRHAGGRHGADRQGAHPATAGYRRQAVSGSSDARGYRSAVGTDDFAPAGNGYGATGGYDWDGNGYRAADGYPGQLGPGSYVEYTEPVPGDPRLVAPDVGVHPGTWQDDLDSRREARQRGMAVGAVTVFLAMAVAIGVSTLAAAFVRPQVAPVSAMGSVFIDRVPAALRHAVTQHFGASGQSVLLLGMYAAIAVVALVIGGLARRSAALGVAGVAAFTVFTAFVAATRPASHLSAVVPALVGGVAGVAALLWLVRASAPMTPLRHARAGTRRRA
jgi:hypothetical protein